MGMNTARIYCFGDSQAYGAWDSEGGWCDRLKRKAHALTLDSADGVKYQMFNLGIGGEHSRALLRRMKNELEARHRPDWPPVIIIGTGENDTRYAENGEPFVSIEEYRSNLEALIAIAEEYTDKIILVGLTLTEQPEQPFKTSFFSHELLRKYDAVMVEIASKHNIAKTDTITALEAAVEPVYYKDGVHLNDKGHETVAGLVWDELEKLLTEEPQDV
jgi:lysophospholipase L1-like esterase